ncbi:MAG: cupin domain-containing protein [Clostridia bacterium]|nr:cupin domain-containing protein [Clostridia bacterium]
MEQMTGLDFKIREMAARIRDLRELENLTVADMARKTGVSEEEYLRCEEGKSDLNFAFIYRCAMALNVNVTDIIEGYSPKLKSYTVTRAGAGQKVSHAHGMTYYNLAYAFRDRIAEPLYVRCLYDSQAEQKDIELTTHAGQECDLVIEGNLMVQVGEHKEVLGPGDSIYFDSDTPHGMIAVNGKDCVFYAIVLNPTGEPIPELTEVPAAAEKKVHTVDTKDRIDRNFIDVTENENGTPTSITFKNTDQFNFAYDLVDALAEREPEKLAMLHISRDGEERRFTFKDMKKASAQCANYFKSLGIRKGDRVMLVLKGIISSGSPFSG